MKCLVHTSIKIILTKFDLKFQITFIGTDWETLGKALGKECLPKHYGGLLPVDDVDGKLIIDLLDQFTYQLECKMRPAGSKQFCCLFFSFYRQ